MAKTKGRHHYPLPRFPPVDFPGSFRDNIQMFVSGYGDLLEDNPRGMPTWFTVLADQKSGAGVPLFTVEEYVRSPTDQSCAHCSRTGWSRHFMCKYRYHFIIPAEDGWGEHLDPDDINRTTHLLHGMIHGSGFGHLIQMKWPDGEVKCIPGGVLMDLWDRICTSLRTREVSVVDTACWKAMELRLLLGVARRTPWYGIWDYTKFHIEALGATEVKYKKSAKLLSSIDLDGLIQSEVDGRIEEGQELKRIVNTYRQKSEMSRKLRVIETLGDLLRYMLDLLELEKKMKPISPPTPQPSPSLSSNAMVECSNKKFIAEARDFSEVAAKLDNRFPLSSLLNAAEAIAEVLRVGTRGQHPSTGAGALLKMTMTRKELRDAAITRVRNTGLLDTVLKNIVDCIVSNHVVRRLYNQSSGVLEYTLEDRQPPENATEVVAAIGFAPCSTGSTMSLVHVQVKSDLAWVYEHVLLKGPYQEAVSTVLMSKRWLKVWPLGTEKNCRLRFLCQWTPSDGLLHLLKPPEVEVVLEPDVVVGSLMREAEKSLRETYCVMEGFRATRLEQVNGKVLVTGVGVDLEKEKLIFECNEDGEEGASSSLGDSNEEGMVGYAATLLQRSCNGNDVSR